MKKCSVCSIDKMLSEFNKRADSKDGYAHQCRKCAKQNGKKYYSENKNEIKKYQKEFYKKNNEYILNRVTNYRELNIDKIRDYDKKRRLKRKGYLNNYSKTRRESDFLFKISSNLRNRINKFIKNKSKSTENIIGITFDELKIYLEKKFSSGMSWDNYGKWHIDHIKPLSSAKTESEIYELCHYSNLQPLWAEDNLKKGSKIL
jgi:RecA-family ATPase